MPIDFQTPHFPHLGGALRRRLYITSALIVALIVFLSINEIYVPHARSSGSRMIEISPGFGSRMIGDKLKDEGFIRSKWAFVTYVTLRGQASSLKPGTYEFDSASIRFIAAALVKGNTDEKIVTLPEGSTIDELSQILANQGVIASPAFVAFASRSPEKELKKTYQFLEQIPALASLEGYLFPDTYHLFKGAAPKDIANAFLQNFDKKLTPEIRNNIKRSGRTLHQIIIMASLIEREIVSDHDRKIVSGILWKRLRLDIPLQVDATISYIKKQRHIDTAAKDGKISRSDLLLTSPHNTYLHRGLPAGPIGNPGMSAILAAIHPISSAYFYYLSTPDGRTIFSHTLEEHNAARVKYLR